MHEVGNEGRGIYQAVRLRPQRPGVGGFSFDKRHKTWYCVLS